MSTANALLRQFEGLGVLREVTGRKRNRRYRYEPYLQLFEAPALPDGTVSERGWRPSSEV